jgi:hypothetical protein
MAFATGYLADPAKVRGGERFGNTNIILSAARGDWSGINVGRYAQVKAGIIEDMDGTATPTIAGVVLRLAANAVEDGSVLDSNLFDHMEYLRQGLVTVDVKAGETAPSLFGAVQASNAGDANDGLAVATGGIDTNSEFLRVVAPNVWLVRLK